MRNHRPEVSTITKKLRELLNDSVAIILIGSVARNCATHRSDVDVLGVGEEEPEFKLRAPMVEFHTFSARRFLSELHGGDDFPNWCTRFGVPLAGNQYWKSLLERSEHANWPGWKR